MGLMIYLYNSPEPRGVNTYLNSSSQIGSVDYNGIDLSMPTGEIRLAMSESALNNLTHFVVFLPNGNLYRPRVFRITGAKSINANVTTFTYELDYLKDYYLNSTTPSMLNTLPILKEFGVASQSSNWAQWRDDPSFPNTGGCGYGLSYGKYTPGYMNALVVNNGIDHACRPNVYLLGLGDTQVLINYLNTSQYAAAFYKQIVGLYLVPYLAGDWTGAAVNNGKLLGDFTVTNEALTFTAIDEDGNTITDTVSPSVSRLNITGDVYTNIDTNLSITLQDFLDIYHTRYNLYVPYVGNVDIPIKAWAKVARAQTASITIECILKFSYNFYDGTFVMSFEDTLSFYTNPAMTPGMYREQIPMPTIALPSGATAFSLYSNKLSLQSQVASTAIQGAVAAASGNLPGVAMSAVNIGLDQYRADLKNDMILASGQSYGACNGYLGSTLNQFVAVAIWEIFYQTYDEYSGMNGFIPLNQILDANDYYPDIEGRTVLFDTTHAYWHRGAYDDYPTVYMDGLIRQIEGKPVYFAPQYMPSYIPT